MSKISDSRMTAQIEGDFVVFLIGMRINRFWKVTKWVPAFMAMPRMLKELSTRPSEETGFLGYNILGFGNIVQYWRSFDHAVLIISKPTPILPKGSISPHGSRLTSA
jgi:hypothetical protein